MAAYLGASEPIPSLGEERGVIGGGGGGNNPPGVTGPVTLPSSEENTSVTITKEQLVSNTIDPEGDVLSILSLTPSSGSLTAGVNQWVYTPVLDTTGTITFTYSVSDGQASTATSAAMTLTATADVYGVDIIVDGVGVL